MLDLSHFTSPEQLAPIRRLEQIALVVVPPSLSAAYTLIPAEGIASTVYVPDGANTRIHTGVLVVGGDGLKVLSGQLKLSEPLLANESGDPGDILVVAGPAAQRDVIEPRLEAQGQVIWYEGDDPRVFFDDVELGPDFSGCSATRAA